MAHITTQALFVVTHKQILEERYMLSVCRYRSAIIALSEGNIYSVIAFTYEVEQSCILNTVDAHSLCCYI